MCHVSNNTNKFWDMQLKYRNLHVTSKNHNYQHPITAGKLLLKTLSVNILHYNNCIFVRLTRDIPRQINECFAMTSSDLLSIWHVCRHLFYYPTCLQICIFVSRAFFKICGEKENKKCPSSKKINNWTIHSILFLASTAGEKIH